MPEIQWVIKVFVLIAILYLLGLNKNKSRFKGRNKVEHV